MTVAGASQPLMKAVGARREMQHHLDCLTRQIAARAVRQATTLKVQRRAKRRLNARPSHQELVERLTFERWGELDAIAGRLARQDQVINQLGHHDHAPERLRAA